MTFKVCQCNNCLFHCDKMTIMVWTKEGIFEHYYCSHLSYFVPFDHNCQYWKNESKIIKTVLKK